MDIQTLSQEIWRKSPLAPDHVEVSNFGRARTLDRMTYGIREGKPAQQLRKGKILSPWISDNGYFCISVQVAPKREKYLLHRLIASAFCEGFDASLSVNHIDGNKLNNLPHNLEWVTLNRNTQHQWEIGLVNLRGQNHPGSKISDEQARAIKKGMLSGISATLLAKTAGVSVALCYKIKDGKRHHC